MSVIEIQRFRLSPGVDRAAFVEADGRAQVDVAYRQPGLVRRTTASGDDGSWLVITLWVSATHAEAAVSPLEQLASFVDGKTIETARYTTID
jgi:hypothetical protein